MAKHFVSCCSNLTVSMNSLATESNDDDLSFNSLPGEMTLKIFSYLTQNELCRIARVCKKWNTLTRCPILWKKVNVKFYRRRGSQNAEATCFLNRLPECVSYIRLDFINYKYWTEPLNFKEFSAILHEKCPHLKVLFLHHSKLSDSLPLVIDLCTEFLPKVKCLVLHFSEIPGCPARRECDGISEIEVLDVSSCYLGHLNKPPFSRMSHLKELRLALTCVPDSWFEDDISFLNQVEVLNLSDTWTGSTAFQSIQNHALNLKELYICGIALEDDDLNFNCSVFPQLDTICLGSCHRVTCEGIVALMRSCQSLQNIYINENVVETFSKHHFTVDNQCKLGIVKAISCDHYHAVDYLNK